MFTIYQMAYFNKITISVLLFSLFLVLPIPCLANSRILALVEQPPLVLKYHNGALLKGHVTINLIWYGKFSSNQRAIIIDFIQSLSPNHTRRQPHHSAGSWWRTTEEYKGGPSVISLGKQIFDQKYSQGKLLKDPQLESLASKATQSNSIAVVLTAADVAVEDFCLNRCGMHEWTRGKKGSKYAYAWVGNSASQCPGQCAWPFYKPIVGPQTPPLVAPNGDVGVDGMVINLATVLAGTVTNPFDGGYYQGPANAPLEAVSACTGIFGSGAFPGFPGNTLVDKTTGSSYNADGVNGRKYLLPAMWNPKTSTCKTLV
ncbi:protein EXORDIUM-like 2 [Nicotiana tomentosiformis]|uniref:protein EXORDIUM-like 2 n=1 Tax=Nicotiana tomentosiformis TaxID=4098 RepID=UPI00051CA167|nr:protein EXORDIUM-like 2 [Nicotiana tomentosiformis]